PWQDRFTIKACSHMQQRATSIVDVRDRKRRCGRPSTIGPKADYDVGKGIPSTEIRGMKEL
ncbi:hypothetical protein IscW_ISCW005102, partial [Ixodes scapularis]